MTASGQIFRSVSDVIFSPGRARASAVIRSLRIANGELLERPEK